MKSSTQEIYVHIPFCERKCDYCDFVSFVENDDTKEAYFSMLKNQIDIKAEFAGNTPVDSVFFGGGTPSCVNPQYIYDVMNRLRDKFVVTKDVEVTIEMNPNSVSEEKLKIYKEAGINRVSIGLQSSNDSELVTLSRLHNYEGFLGTFDMVRKCGFENVNIDIMSGLPGQTVSSYLDTLKKVTMLNPEHISAYSLIIEEGTPFYNRYENGSNLPGEEVDREMYHLTKTVLLERGYERYEISNYSKPGKECKHNVGYWVRKPYLGLGIAAASLINETRFSMHSDLKRYLMGDFCEDKEVLSKQDMMEEFMILGLRMIKGVSKADFKILFGMDIETVYGKEIDKLRGQNLIKEEDGRLFLTELGLDLANVAMSEFC